MLWHKIALRVNISKEEASGNIGIAERYLKFLITLLKAEIKQYENEATKQLISLAELCSALCRLCSLLTIPEDFERGLDQVVEVEDLMNKYDQCDDRRVVFQAKIDALRLKSLDAKKRGDFESAILLQECVVDAFLEMEGDSMRSSDELWRLSHLHFWFGDVKFGMKFGKESIRIADILRGRQDPTVRMRKSDLDKKTEAIPLLDAPVICRCIADFSFGRIKEGDGLEIVKFFPKTFSYAVRKEGLFHIVDWDAVNLLKGTKVQILGMGNPLFDGRFGRIIDVRNGAFGPSYTVEVTSLNRVVRTMDCYAVGPEVPKKK